MGAVVFWITLGIANAGGGAPESESSDSTPGTLLESETVGAAVSNVIVK